MSELPSEPGPTLVGPDEGSDDGSAPPKDAPVTRSARGYLPLHAIQVSPSASD